MNTTPPKKRGRPEKPVKKDVEELEPVAPTEDVVVVTNTDYTLELSIGGELFTSTAPTPLEALKNLDHPVKMITKGTITVRHGDRTKELFFMPIRMKRMFYPLALVANAKMLGMNM